MISGRISLFIGPPEDLTFYVGSNNMWSTNTAPNHGLCNASNPMPAQLHADNAYTIVSIGKVTMTTPDLVGATYSVDMDVANAYLNTSFTNVSSGLEVNISVFATRAVDSRDRIFWRISSNRDISTTVTPSTSSTTENKFRLPAFSGVDGGVPWVARMGVTEARNNLVLGLLVCLSTFTRLVCIVLLWFYSVCAIISAPEIYVFFKFSVSRYAFDFNANIDVNNTSHLYHRIYTARYHAATILCVGRSTCMGCGVECMRALWSILS